MKNNIGVVMLPIIRDGPYPSVFMIIPVAKKEILRIPKTKITGTTRMLPPVPCGSRA